MVSEQVREAYYSDYSHKRYVISFPDQDLTYRDDEIATGSCKLTEKLMSSSSIEFVGCNSSQFICQIYGLTEAVKDQLMMVSSYTDDTEDDPIPLFYGYVKSVESTSNQGVRKVVAYDRLNVLAKIGVEDWYNNLTFPVTIKDFRDGLCAAVGLPQADVVLPNDSYTMPQRVNLSFANALTLLKNVCQINGAFGIIGRDGRLDYRYIEPYSEEEGTYPGEDLFPDFYPSDAEGDGIIPQVVGKYRSVKYEAFAVKPVDRVTIRQSEDDLGVSYGDGTNNYIIQGNIFALNQSTETLRSMAQNVYEMVKDFSYVPFKAVNPGIPYLELGKAAVEYYVLSEDRQELVSHVFYPLSRILNCGEAMKDTLEAKGTEFQSEFITDLRTQLESVRVQTSQMQTQIDRMEEQVANGLRVESVTSPPTPETAKPNTIYLLRGEVVVN